MRRRRYLVAYDIREERRIRAIGRVMKAYGWRMQYSVWICDCDPVELVDMRTAIGRCINHAVDSVSIIDLGSPAERGQSCFEFIGVRPRLPAQGPLVV